MLAALIMYAVVIGVGLPAAFRNFTAFALVLAWTLGQATWLLTGDSLPLQIYFMTDMTVIGCIYGKSIARHGGKVYDSFSHQLRCIVTDLTVWDRWIVGLFVLGCWPLYVLTMGDTPRWWALWAITIAQFFFAGREALISWRGAKRAVPFRPDRPPGGLHRMAGNWGYG